MPFGSHLTVDTLPSEVQQAVAPGPPWQVSSFRLRARLDVSIPSAFFGQRGITPAFGYGAPHSSNRGTLTLLLNAQYSIFLDLWIGTVVLVMGLHSTVSILTVVIPCLMKSNFSATARDTSTRRFRDIGPQSLTVASTLLPFFVFVILTLVPHGRLLCAAVSSDASYLPPQAVL